QHDRLQSAQWPIGDLDQIARMKTGAHCHDVDRLTRPLLELFDDCIIDKGRAATKTDNPNDLRRVLHRAEILGEIETAEKVAREQRANDPALDAPDGFEALEPWIIGTDAQDFATIPLRASFLARSCVDAQPARGVGQRASGCSARLGV